MKTREKELQLVGKILDGEDAAGNMERLYLSLEPLFQSVINKHGRDCEREDLMQEMYFALSTAVEQYRDPAVRAKYAFHQVLISNANHKVTAYLLYHYRQYAGEDGKVRAYQTHANAMSLNVKAWDAPDAPDILDILPAALDTEDAFFLREEEEERRAAADVLWGEVDQLPATLRVAVTDRYRLGISHADKAKATGVKRGTVAGQAQRGLKKLRENPRIREIAPAYVPSLAYRGGLGFFKANGISSTEYVALGNIEREERGVRSTYKLVDPSLFDGRTSASVARHACVANGVIQKLRRGERLRQGAAQRARSRSPTTFCRPRLPRRAAWRACKKLSPQAPASLFSYTRTGGGLSSPGITPRGGNPGRRR
jgi:RNA polymerase sigma factor (sigma-70 family)